MFGGSWRSGLLWTKSIMGKSDVMWCREEVEGVDSHKTCTGSEKEFDEVVDRPSDESSCMVFGWTPGCVFLIWQSILPL